MVGTEHDVRNTQHGFVFHGSAGRFFVICLVNFLLTIITLGIYFPWAKVKSRRYIYENMEFNGARFKYSATGGAIFCSFILLFVSLLVTTLIFSFISPVLNWLPMIVLILVMPLMIVKGLRYEAMMTSLNNVRFGFNCRNGQAMWVLLGLPVVITIAGVVVLFLLNKISGEVSDITDLIIRVVVLAVAVLILIGIMNGVCYGKWMQLLSKNAHFGTHAFDINVSIKKCVIACTLAMLILLPFIIVIGKLMIPTYMAFVFASMSGKMDAMTQQALLAEHMPQIMMGYLLYFVGGMLCGTFFVTSLRNIFINGLTLANTLRFQSSITFIGMLAQIVRLVLATMLTCGLAYPWAKICFIRYLANNTNVVGDLDALALADTDEQEDKGFLAAVSRGMFPALPFI